MKKNYICVVDLSFVKKELSYLDYGNSSINPIKKLIYEIEELFISNINDIIKFNWVEKPQISKGTFHLTKDLPNNFKGWNSNINSEIKRLKNK